MSAPLIVRWTLLVLGGLMAALFCSRMVRQIEPGQTEEVEYVHPIHPLL